MAVRQALESGLTTRRRLREAASGRSARVREFVEAALSGEPA
jgi:plasmid stability protein